jgi:hypothetical protein
MCVLAMHMTSTRDGLPPKRRRYVKQRGAARRSEALRGAHCETWPGYDWRRLATKTLESGDVDHSPAVANRSRQP